MRDDDAIKLASIAKEFGFTVATLRAEAVRGRLTIYKIGKQYWTTRSDIRAMVKACRVDLKARSSVSTQNGEIGLSEMDHISSARAALKATLNAHGHS
jgi:hypothetical protein